ADFKIRAADKAPFLAKQHAVPVTVEEFPLVQRFMPIVFSQGEEPVPLALMGLNEGINTFFDEDGSLNETNFYVPAYVRRYPYLLARLRPDSDELSLCFDPTSDSVGAFDEGEALFVDGQPSDTTKNILQFNEQFEQAGA
ncbi:SapC family protein, partial [Escherichia coli]|nr:SapC family protein [Escherichia coli]